MPKKASGSIKPADIAKIVFAVVAVVGAVLFIGKFISDQNGHEVGHAEQPEGFSAKAQSMKDGTMKQNGGAAVKPGADGSAGGKEVDPMGFGDK